MTRPPLTRQRLIRRALVVAFGVAAVIGAIIAWQYNIARIVGMAGLSRGTAVEAVYATGTVEPETWAAIGPVTTGRIAEILVAEGERVREGQQLARLDDREARSRVAELEARAVFWKDEAARARDLAQRGIKSRTDEAKAESEYRQLVAAIAAARQRRADLLVTSPIDGVVLRRDGEVGEVAAVTDTLFWIGQPRPLRITAEVDEEDVAKIHPGQEVLVKADAFPGQVLAAKVDRLTPKGDPVAKTFRLRVALPDDTPLLVGMTTEINIITARHDNALLAPAGALVSNHVFIDEDGKAARRDITVGIRGKEKIEILDGLSGSETLIDNPPAALKPGERVRARNPG